MKKYTIGILLTENLDGVLLIRKVRPEWQAGKLNFPGGHIEENETSVECISREFKEETRLLIPTWQWKYIGQIENRTYNKAIANMEKYFVDIFSAIYNPSTHGDDASSPTEEHTIWCNAQPLPQDCISNLHWLVPFAINIHQQGNADTLDFGKFHYKY